MEVKAKDPHFSSAAHTNQEKEKTLPASDAKEWRGKPWGISLLTQQHWLDDANTDSPLFLHLPVI